MQKHIGFVAALGAILLVGAGCARPPATDSTGEDSFEMRVDTSAEVDATVDAMLEDADEEKTQEAEVEKDAEDVTSDSAELNAVMQGDYELK